jgi:hypothetical protein
MATGLEPTHIAQPETPQSLEQEFLGAPHPLCIGGIGPHRRVAHEGEKPLQNSLALPAEPARDGIAHDRPPSTERTCPEIQPACALARNSAAVAMSSGDPSRLVWIEETRRS